MQNNLLKLFIIFLIISVINFVPFSGPLRHNVVWHYITPWSQSNRMCRCQCAAVIWSVSYGYTINKYSTDTLGHYQTILENVCPLHTFRCTCKKLEVEPSIYWICVWPIGLILYHSIRSMVSLVCPKTFCHFITQCWYYYGMLWWQQRWNWGYWSLPRDWRVGSQWWSRQSRRRGRNEAAGAHL